MKTMHPVLLALALLGSTACGLAPVTLDGNVQLLDASSTNIRLCGFPQSQLAVHPDFGRVGSLRVGQRLLLELRGEIDRIQSIDWYVDPVNDLSPHPPVVRLTPTGRFMAILEGVAIGGDGPMDYVFVGARLTFKDGSEDSKSPSACQADGGWLPANRIQVVP